MNTVYLDNSSTTPLSEEVKGAIMSVMDCFGNPSSLHTLGVNAEAQIRRARQNVAKALALVTSKEHNIIFTSCGSESNNTAIFGTAYSKQCYRQGRIITSATEHPSVLECMKKLEKDGFDVVRLSAKGGVISPDELKNALNEKTFLVSIMTVNNETGAIYDIENLFSAVKSYNPDIITHTDAVQAFGKLKLNPKKMKADLISFSGHKIHAPKGVGGLYISDEMIKKKKIIPFLYGGGQESGIRSGTENTLGIVGLGEAVLHTPNLDKIGEIRQKLINALPESVKINVPCADYYPGILSVTLPSIKSETMLHFLSSKGIFVSSGSACSSNTGHASYVLSDFGLSDFDADCTLRLSFEDNLSDVDIEYVADAFKEGIERLVKIRRR